MRNSPFRRFFVHCLYLNSGSVALHHVSLMSMKILTRLKRVRVFIEVTDLTALMFFFVKMYIVTHLKFVEYCITDMMDMKCLT